MSDIASLDHKLGDNPVKFAPLEPEFLLGFANSFFASAKAPEILTGFWHFVSEKLKNYPACLLVVDMNIKPNKGILSHFRLKFLKFYKFSKKIFRNPKKIFKIS